MMDDMIPPSQPICPHCLSVNVVPANCRNLILSGIGGLLGMLLTILIMLSDKSSDKKGKVGPIIIGSFSGASAGFRFGQSMSDDSTGKSYLCLDCFHFFNHVA